MHPWSELLCSQWPCHSSRSACRLLMRQAFHLAQHLFDPGSYIFAILAHLHEFTAHSFVLFLALFELLPQPLHVALGGSPSFFRGLVQLNGAINFVFQRLKIFRRNLRRYLFHGFHGHEHHSLSGNISALRRSIAQFAVKAPLLLPHPVHCLATPALPWRRGLPRLPPTVKTQHAPSLQTQPRLFLPA